MPTLPPALNELISQLTRLPGIGPKAAERLALGLINWEHGDIELLASKLTEASKRVTYCPICGSLSQDSENCFVCDDRSRDHTLICVVEGPLDTVALERGGTYYGCYHVLGGALSPMKGVLPEDLRISELITRISDQQVKEVIIATNASPDGEATALYLKQELSELDIKMTRLARGLPSGGQLDYADPATLESALTNRTEL